jgi:hypothetical protein
MKLLVFLDPLTSWKNPIAGDFMLRVALEAADPEQAGKGFASGLCAPGEPARRLRARLDEKNRLSSPSLELEEEAYLRAIDELLSSSGSSAALAAYYRGEGPAFEALLRLLERFRSSVLDFDAVFSCQAGSTLDKAAAALGVQSVRLQIWPNHGRRWRYIAYIRCRNAEGRDPLEGLQIADLRDLGLLEVPASVDQRIQGGQEPVNPYECQFLPLSEAVRPAFRSDRRTALVALQSGDDARQISEGAFPVVGEFLEHVLPPLLAARWNCLLIGEGAEAQALASTWADRPGVYLMDPAEEISMKEERRRMLALLSQIDLLVTDSSHMGLEALMYERPVCVLGRPAYAVAGVFPELAAVIDAPTDAPTEARTKGSLDLNAYKDAASLLRAFWFRAYGTPYFGWGAHRKILERVHEEVELNRKFADRPADWARGVVSAFGETGSPTWFENMRERVARLERPVDEARS